MSIYAISDLHLSTVNPKPMDIFGYKWTNHWEKIKENWENTINEEDVILIPGDISWALTLDEALPDIIEISKLPGRKILIKGNHDYWWDSLSKMRRIFPENINLIQNDSIDIGDFIICGTRGWILPGDEKFEEKDKKIFSREIIRLQLSLSHARAQSEKEIIVMIHYPPLNEKNSSSEFIKLMKKYNVKTCIYGHLHSDSLNNAREGLFEGINFYVVSCDYLDFKLKKIF